MKNLNLSLYNYIKGHFNHNPYTNVLGLARTLIATGLLLTLLFNSSDTLFPSINHQAANIFLRKGTGPFITHNFFLLLGFANVHIMKLIAIVLLLAIASGVYPRYLCLVHWFIHYSFIVSSSAVDGGDQIAANLTMLLIPFCLLDNRRFHWTKSNWNYETPSIRGVFLNFCYLFLRLQVAVIYLHAAVGKLNVVEWVNGTAIYYWFNNVGFKVPDWLETVVFPLYSNGMVLATLTWGTIVLEFVLFAALFMPQRKRNVMLVVGLIFHFLILSLIGLISFFFSISAALIIYLHSLDKPFEFKFSIPSFQRKLANG